VHRKWRGYRRALGRSNKLGGVENGLSMHYSNDIVAKLICVKYLHGFCEDADREQCDHHEPHAPSWTCNDRHIICEDGTPTECLPMLEEPDQAVN
jgi:hypothetical protein